MGHYANSPECPNYKGSNHSGRKAADGPPSRDGLPNSPVTPQDVIIVNKLFGPDIGALKGKTTHHGPPIVDSPISVDITFILKYYGKVTLCIDLMYINKVPLLVTLS